VLGSHASGMYYPWLLDQRHALYSRSFQRLCHWDADCVFTKEDLAELDCELTFETDANPR